MISIKQADNISVPQALGLAWALKFLCDLGTAKFWDKDWELSPTGSQDWIARSGDIVYIFDDQAWNEELGEASPPRCPFTVSIY